MLPIKEREFLRKLVQDFIVKKNPIEKKSEIVSHFVKTGIASLSVLILSFITLAVANLFIVLQTVLRAIPVLTK